MRGTNRALPVGLAVLVAALASGCATAAFTTSCRPGEPSLSCCIKKFPLSPVESCAATEADALATLVALSAAYEATNSAEDEDDFANNASLPEWKQECIRNYVACRRDPDWQGPCYDCIRRCEGQQEWPFDMCWPPRKKRK